MSKTAQTRLDDTFKYLEKIQGISKTHLSELKIKYQKDATVSALISIDGSWTRGDNQKNKRHAGRALFLCMNWYGAANKISDAKSYYKNKTENEIVEAVKSFFPLQGKTKQDVVLAAKTGIIKPNAGPNSSFNDNNFYKVSRAEILAGRQKFSLACYESVTFWMYTSGLVSLRWLKKFGTQPQGKAVPSSVWRFGPVKVASATDASRIPAGNVIRYFRPPLGLHYVISIGSGKCIGNHNSTDMTNPKVWLSQYGGRPTGHTSEFQIAGYLATMQDQFNKQVKRKPRTDEIYLIHGSIEPVNKF
ncbi:hypothetical protein [Colwellia psychrerythraea]|uniref:Uncharacterized protein n=1 Tax=Colwellia psychrerythraea TaxID=28229 RepID=A0A099L127_COLPS|nr:hypothetical protein [Colwellia psychrerythraea]KGJ96669.1 hypothetical protein GAB14E_1743 [Colwellia psychrerythraea]